MVPFLIYQVPEKAASFEWGQKQEKALQQAQTTVQAALPFGSHDPTDTVALEVLVTNKDTVWNLWQAPQGK